MREKVKGVANRKYRKIIGAFILVLALTLPVVSCAVAGSETTTADSSGAADTSDGSVVAVNVTQDPTDVAVAVHADYDSEDLDSDWNAAAATTVLLDGDSVFADGPGAIVEGSMVTVTSGGTYVIGGTLNDGRIRVDTQDETTVRLVLNGVDITCSDSAAIYIVNAEKTVVTLAAGTTNSITDGTVYVFEDSETDEPSAAIFSHDDLTINGDGSLTINAMYNHGIQCKDDLKITGGTIAVYAVNDGIKGKDSIAVLDGSITISVGGDGMQSNNETDPEKGNVYVDGGNLTIAAVEDGIQAETNLFVNGGTIEISSGGGSSNSSTNFGMPGNTWDKWNEEAGQDDDATASAKGLKAGAALEITAGTINIDSSDDSVHSNGTIAITGGSMTLDSGDDGIHADTEVTIQGGEIDILGSYEGIESAVITISDGQIHVVSSDDGINVSGGADGSSVGGRPGQNDFAASGDDHLAISGGYIYVDAMGDGIDSNGWVTMTGGIVIVNGPTSNNNGPLDYMGSFDISGGFLVAAGSSGMSQAPSASSTQYSVRVNLTSSLPAGTMFHIESEDGDDILTFVPTKDYQSVVFSSADLESGKTYIVYTGGSSTGIATDGLYEGGEYAGGTQVESFTISSMVTTVGSSTMEGGMPRSRGIPPGTKPR